MTKKKRTTGGSKPKAPKNTNGPTSGLRFDQDSRGGTASFSESEWRKIKSGSNITYYNPATKETISRYQYIKRTKGASPAQLAKQNKAKAVSEGKQTKERKPRKDSRKAQESKRVPDYISPDVKQISHKWSRLILEHRYQTIEDKLHAGLITAKQAKDLDYLSREEWRQRNKQMELYDRLYGDFFEMSLEERRKLLKKYKEGKEKLKRIRKRIDKYDIIPHGTDMDQTYYH